MMRILLVHNPYREPGGEDRVFATEAQVLRERGHHVLTYTRQTPGHAAAVLRLSGQTFWNETVYRELRKLIRDERPDLVHLHNTFPVISPAAYYAAGRENVPTVQTLHNYRLLCPNGLFLRDGRPCEDCMHTSVPWPAVAHACYRGSHAASAVAAGMLAVHRIRGTWSTMVTQYIVMTQFAREKFIAGGLPAERIAVKPHMVHPDLGPGAGDGGFALFAGRLSHEKGIKLLLGAWRSIAHRLPLMIVGDGPLRDSVREAASSPGIFWLGQRSPSEVQELLGEATCLVMPSICYETFGLVMVEAYARGTPVVAAQLGALAELVDHERTGLQFVPGNQDDLVAQVVRLVDQPAMTAAMRTEARAEYVRRYAVDANYKLLHEIYAQAISARSATMGARA